MELLKNEEKEELLHIAEETFFETMFEVAVDEETMISNYQAALRIFYEKYVAADQVAEDMCDGVITDETTAMLKIQELVISYKYVNRFRNQISGKGIVNPGTIELPEDRTQLAIQGNELLGKFATSKDYDDYEKGKWMLFKTMS